MAFIEFIGFIKSYKFYNSKYLHIDLKLQGYNIYGSVDFSRFVPCNLLKQESYIFLTNPFCTPYNSENLMLFFTRSHSPVFRIMSLISLLF